MFKIHKRTAERSVLFCAFLICGPWKRSKTTWSITSHLKRKSLVNNTYIKPSLLERKTAFSRRRHSSEPTETRPSRVCPVQRTGIELGGLGLHPAPPAWKWREHRAEEAVTSARGKINEERGISYFLIEQTLCTKNYQGRPLHRSNTQGARDFSRAVSAFGQVSKIKWISIIYPR